MTMAVSKAVEEGATAVICASTGNTSASAAAYAARAGLTAACVIPEGKIAAGKLAQALAHGAQRAAASTAASTTPWWWCASWSSATRSPWSTPSTRTASTGQKTAAFEVVRRARRRARRALHPGGQRGQHQRLLAGLPGTARRGARESCRACSASRPPAPRRSSTARPSPGRDRGHGDPHRQPRPLATGAGGDARVGRRRGAVTDAQILAACRMLAAEEGIFCEPASAASVAGLIQRAEAGDLRRARPWSASSPATA